MNELTKRLFDLQDVEYKKFHSKLMPTVDENKIIGVRVPNIRKIAKEYAHSSVACEFMKVLPHEYYEEYNLHGFFIEKIKDYNECIEALNKFLPYVDNWATCDMTSPLVLKTNLQDLLNQIKQWISSEHTYMVRFGIGMLMRFYLDEYFKKDYLNIVADIKSNEYYINMMIAWYFATALVKQYDETLTYLTERKLSIWTHNKTIQKAVESYRITPEQKTYLRSLRIK